MTANAEARALLDQLMGTDRDAPLPTGAALPSRSKRPLGGEGGGMILPSSKKSKSVYDRDIDPLYTAWGIDVYDLFVNTKSDIGPNPYTVDKGARKEYLSLPTEEKERLGFEARLFSKLQELVQHCDRTVARNQEKLQRELQRQSQKRGTQDYVVDVPDGAVEELARTEIQLNFMKEDLEEALVKLAEVRSKEKAIANELNKNENPPNAENQAQTEDSEQNDTLGVKEVPLKEVDGHKPGTTATTKIQIATSHTTDGYQENSSRRLSLAKLGGLALEKQALLCQIANIISQLGPVEDSIEVQERNLNHVKSDITSDKTVCEVSGNFMSARDADERIAAHYAGKQYVGWKLVRDKLKEMIQQYGKYGPSRPGGIRSGGNGGNAPLMSHQQYQQQQSQWRDGRGGHRNNDRRGDGRWERGGGGGGGYERGGVYGRRDDRVGQFRENRGNYGRR